GIRWTEATKREIMSSRVESTGHLVRAMDRTERKPRAFVCASGVGYYGAHGEEPLDETSSQGGDFLARVTVAWEAAARGAEAFGVRVVRARLGIVLGRDGGALAQMAMPFKLFVGGPIASGTQIVSWVHLDDAVAIFLRLVDDARIQGAVNVVSPNAVH